MFPTIYHHLSFAIKDLRQFKYLNITTSTVSHAWLVMNGTLSVLRAQVAMKKVSLTRHIKVLKRPKDSGKEGSHQIRFKKLYGFRICFVGLTSLIDVYSFFNYACF